MKINLLNTKVPTRSLIHLCEEKYEHPKTWHIGFCYYENDPYTGRLEFTGVGEECHITERQLYQLLKPVLQKEKRPTRRDLRREE